MVDRRVAHRARVLLQLGHQRRVRGIGHGHDRPHHLRDGQRQNAAAGRHAQQRQEAHDRVHVTLRQQLHCSGEEK